MGSEMCIRDRVVPPVAGVGAPSQAHEQRHETRDEEEIAGPVERLDFGHERQVAHGTRGRLNVCSGESATSLGRRRPGCEKGKAEEEVGQEAGGGADVSDSRNRRR